MNSNLSNNKIQRSTYAMLVRSEEKQRGLLETLVYGIFILSAVAAIWQFAQETTNLTPDSMSQVVSAARAEITARS